ncbi:MAG: radical SAM protein [PVC group bacterium]|nr:radical SAM protein [PVC group bacterium]
MGINIFKKLTLVKPFLKAKFTSCQIPLFVGWDLTYRCNSNCIYCQIPGMDTTNELTTQEVIKGIEQLYQLGTKRIHFGGGEVLLRDDLDEIFLSCKEKDISFAILTNGILFKEKLDAIRHADLVKISFDGPQQIHDSLRGKGLYDKVIEAVSLAKDNNINIVFNTTLSTENVDYVDNILEFAKTQKVPVKFQLVNEYLAGTKNIESLKLSGNQQKRVMTKLILSKRKNKYIVNSKAALQYMYAYPDVKNIPCAAGKIYVRISAEGYLYPCQMMREHYSPDTYVKGEIKSSFNALPQVKCNHCLCTPTLELNRIYAMKFSALFLGLKSF